MNTVVAPDQFIPVDDLQNYRQQFEAIKTDAQSLLAGLDDAQFNWRPGPGQWSIGECVHHLVVSSRSSLTNMQQAIKEARSQGLFSRGPFRYSPLERWFVRAMGPLPRWKFKAPKAYAPLPDRPFAEVVPDFFALQEELLSCLQAANGLDLAKIKVQNPVSKWIRFSLGQEFALNAAHERRHLWQARRIRENPNFPRA